MGTPLTITPEEATRATEISERAADALKEGAVLQDGTTYVESIPGFNASPPEDLIGIQKIITAVGIGIGNVTDETPLNIPNSLVKRDAEGDFSARDVTAEKFILADGVQIDRDSLNLRFQDTNGIFTLADVLARRAGPVRAQEIGIYLIAFDSTTEERKVGLGASISAMISKDGGVLTPTTNSVSEVGNGLYYLILTANEMDASTVLIDASAVGTIIDLIELYTSPK